MLILQGKGIHLLTGGWFWAVCKLETSVGLKNIPQSIKNFTINVFAIHADSIRNIFWSVMKCIKRNMTLTKFWIYYANMSNDGKSNFEYYFNSLKINAQDFGI